MKCCCCLFKLLFADRYGGAAGKDLQPFIGNAPNENTELVWPANALRSCMYLCVCMYERCETCHARISSFTLKCAGPISVDYQCNAEPSSTLHAEVGCPAVTHWQKVLRNDLNRTLFALTLRRRE
jgi:hypothetical protein